MPQAADFAGHLASAERTLYSRLRKPVSACRSSHHRTAMNHPRPERLAPQHRMRAARDFAAVRQQGAAHRGRCCLLLSLPSPGEVTRLGWIASKRGVGGAVQRNRARRRVREIVRRRWPRIPHEGFLLVFITSRAVLTAPHQQLATEVESLLAHAGALAPALGA